jgi:coenzyme F420 hydrogenase subunit alpha
LAETVELSPTTRHEGHGKLVLLVDDEGYVERAFYLNTSAIRGFEAMAKGRPAEFVQVAVMRICGICQATHGTASAEAFERAMGIEPPKAGRQLRELCALGNRIQSHVLHQLLVLDDFVEDEKEKVEAIKRIQQIRKIGQYVVDVVGGEGIHPPNIRIGGMASNITETARRKLYRRLREARDLMEEQHEFMMDAIESYCEEEGIDMETFGKHDQPFLATHPTYGDPEKIDFDRVVELRPIEYYGKENLEIALEHNGQIPLYDGVPVEVGPRARYAVFDAVDARGVLYIHVYRSMETLAAIDRAMNILDELNTSAPTLAEWEPKAGFGIGVHEAPRGTNVHMAEVDEKGIVKNYRIIAASTWNFPTVEKAIEGEKADYAEVIMRCYDI